MNQNSLSIHTLFDSEQFAPGTTVGLDGSEGEGGGQILRTSTALAAICGVPLRIEKIRAGRPKPGLARQHLTAMNAIQRVSLGSMNGASLGSKTLDFTPQQIQGGLYDFRIGTAGSATLVFQTILPALLAANCPSTVSIEGGTHNQWAPPVDFLQKSFLPLLHRMGCHVESSLIRHGFHPAGGGRVEFRISPATILKGFKLVNRGNLLSRRIRVRISNLPINIAEREQQRLIRKLKWKPDEVIIEPVESSGPGNVLLAELEFENLTEVMTAFGRLGTSAEHVADELVHQVQEYLSTDAPVGEYLADQLLLPLALSAAQKAGPGAIGCLRGGSFRTGPLSKHALTQIDVIRRFLPVRFQITEEAGTNIVSVQSGDGSHFD